VNIRATAQSVRDFTLVSFLRGGEFGAEGKELYSRELSKTTDAGREESGDQYSGEMNGDGEQNEL